MRRSVEDLKTFYQTPLGESARRLIGVKLSEAWKDVQGQDVLGIGYPVPWLEQLGEARRILAAMPARQGAEIWPADMRVRTVLVEEDALPFPAGLFDRVLLVHALEEAADPHRLLLEASRLLSPSGRLIVVVAARGGFWAHAERTPFGHGQPYSRSQLDAALRAAELEPLAFSYALHAPPIMLRWAGLMEKVAPMVWPVTGGVILMEAGRKPFVAQTRVQTASLLKDLQGVLAGQPVPTS